jgi:hypothetical protein
LVRNRQIASDLHLLTWPIRFVIGFIKTCLFAAAYIVGVPLIFAGLLLHYILTGQALLDADAVLALKVIFCFCQPFILPIVYRFAQMGTKKRNRAQVKATFYLSMHWVFVAVLMLELVGALLNYGWWDAMATEGSLGVLVLYLSSPLVFLLFKKDQIIVAPVPPQESRRLVSTTVVWVQSSQSAGAHGLLGAPPETDVD